ncbi:hypothetical protein ACFXGR_22455 [Streptomyces mirabilis]|uniref:hypothetical protein n=1 Tax=Streptomyces mirabilis TaxID=68239 RepID=UPI003689707E
MSTLAPEAITAPASSVTPTRLLDAPLPQLLDELDVLLVDSSITDRGFFGAVVERRDGQLILAMPAGRSTFERDTVARMLLGEALGVGSAPVPEPLRMEVPA